MLGRRIAAAVFLALSICAGASGQQVFFTTRGHLQCPVVLVSAEQSKTFGFESIVLQGDGAMPVRAVRLRVVLRTRAGEEVTDDRRIAVNLPPLDRKRVVVGLGHIEGLRQKAKSRGEEAGLAIISIASVEFGDGSVWEAGGPTEGVPIEPLPLPRTPRK